MALAILLGSLAVRPVLAGNALTWTMVNVNHTPQQGDAHVLRFANGKVVLIDAAHMQPALDALIPFLREQKITRIHQFFATHPHKDHYQGIKAILDSGIKVDEAYFNLPDKVLCDGEIPWGCDYPELLTYRDLLVKAGVKLLPAVAGQSFSYGKNSRIKILYAFDGINTPVGRTDINDLSLVMRIEQGPTSILMTGDLNLKIGTYLADKGKDLKATILKLPHHGTEGAAPDAFFARVAPRIALVPSPALLWCSARSARMKAWFGKKRIPTYVNGFSGHVTVNVNGPSIRVQEQYAKRVRCQPE